VNARRNRNAKRIRKIGPAEPIIEALIDGAYFKPKKKNAAAAMLELAQWAKKHKVTGPRDLSTNDEYLYGKLALDYPLRGK